MTITPPTSPVLNRREYFYEDPRAYKKQRTILEDDTRTTEDIIQAAAENSIPPSNQIPLSSWNFTQTPFLDIARRIKDSQIILFQGTTFNISPPISQGNYSEARLFLPNQDPFIPGIANEDLLVKTYKHYTFEVKGYLYHSMSQYQTLEEDFAHLPAEARPYGKIYNKDTLQRDGYTLVEKVDAINYCPWDEGATLENLTEIQRDILDQVKALFHYSYYKNSPKAEVGETKGIRKELLPGLDLWWPNLGIRPGTNTVVIFDYLEEHERDILISPYPMDRIDQLANNSPSIKAYILGDIQPERDRELALQPILTDRKTRHER